MVGFSPIVRPDGSGQELTDATAEARAVRYFLCDGL